MVNLRNKYVAGPLALFVAVVVTATTALVWGGTATGASRSGSSETAAAERTVARTDQGTVNSRIRGTTADDERVTGAFVPLKFSKRNGKLRVRGLIQGVVHEADGSTRTFAVLRTVRVRSVEGVPLNGAAARQVQAAPACDVLNLVLGPLDLDLLGLQVSLNRVVLNIVAQSGAGNLLGNLLCAVAGLLDGGLQGVLGRVVRLLNRILARLGLGL
jgi:hypothetical protein